MGNAMTREQIEAEQRLKAKLAQGKKRRALQSVADESKEQEQNREEIINYVADLINATGPNSTHQQLLDSSSAISSSVASLICNSDNSLGNESQESLQLHLESQALKSLYSEAATLLESIGDPNSSQVDIQQMSLPQVQEILKNHGVNVDVFARLKELTQQEAAKHIGRC